MRDTGRKKEKRRKNEGRDEQAENHRHGIRELKGPALCVHKFGGDSDFEFAPVGADIKITCVCEKENTSTHFSASLHRPSYRLHIVFTFGQWQ